MNYYLRASRGNANRGGAGPAIKLPSPIETGATANSSMSATSSASASNASTTTIVTAPPADDTPQASPTGSLEVVSASRSRASSIFSTGTKTSINTLPSQPPAAEAHRGPIDVVLGRRNFRITARPGSILSISSFDHPAPPYSEAIGADASQSTATLTAASFQHEEDAEDEAYIEQPTPVARRAQPLLLSTAAAAGDDATIEPEVASQPQTRSPSPPSPPMSPLSSSTNAISAHYTQVVRTIDSNHRVELERLYAEIQHLHADSERQQQEHAAALAQTRNDIDAAYRLPFREARDRAVAAEAEAAANTQVAEERAEELDALKTKHQKTEKELSVLHTVSEKELQALRDEIETLKEAAQQLQLAGEGDVLRARNEVEDIWEGRWRDRMRLAAEQVTGSWEDGRDTGWYEGVLQGCRNVKAIWERTQGRPLPTDLQDEVDRWEAEAERRRRPPRR